MYMFTFDIEKYLGHYVDKAKKISVRNFRYSVTNGIIEKKKGYRDVDLFFNDNGRLLEVIHLDRRIEKSAIYYDKKNQIIKIIKSRWSTNEIISEIDTGYDEQDRLIYESEKLDFTDDNCLYAQELFYTYEGNIRTTNMYREYDEEHYIITETFDENGNIIEMKAFEGEVEFQYWIKDLFDENNKYVRTMSLNEDGTEDKRDDKAVIEDTYDEKFSYNDRNNWIVKEVYKNNILKESTERSITYY